LDWSCSALTGIWLKLSDLLSLWCKLLLLLQTMRSSKLILTSLVTAGAAGNATGSTLERTGLASAAGGRPVLALCASHCYPLQQMCAVQQAA